MPQTNSPWRLKYGPKQEQRRLAKVARGICYDCDRKVCWQSKWRCSRCRERVNAARRVA